MKVVHGMLCVLLGIGIGVTASSFGLDGDYFLSQFGQAEVGQVLSSSDVEGERPVFSAVPELTVEEVDSATDLAEPSDVVDLLEEVEEVEVLEEVEPYTFSLLGVGDNLIHKGIYNQAAAKANWRGYDFSFTYEPVAELIAGADLSSINQETVLSWRYEASSYPRFNTPPEMAVALQDVGFDIVSLANNHMYDKGEQGLQDTLELLKWDHGFTVTGAYLNQEDYLAIPVHEIGTVKVAFVATTQTTNGLSIPSSSPLVGSVTAEEEGILEFLAQVERATAVADLVVANIHWGAEYTHEPTDFQVDLAHRAIEAGVDVIFGHHPHVIQPVEYITRSDGTVGVVCYSLGNFISLQSYSKRMIGGMLDVTFSVEGEEITMEKVEFLPCITQIERNYANIQVFSYEDYSASLASRHMLSMSMWYIYDTVTKVIESQFLPERFYEIYA